MKHLLAYRETNYFNENDYFLLQSNFNRFFITQVHFYNGNWYSNVSLQYKMTSVRSVNCNELKNLKVKYVNTTLKGVITKFLEPNTLGILWGQGEDYRTYGLPYFWNDIKNIELL